VQSSGKAERSCRVDLGWAVDDMELIVDDGKEEAAGKTEEDVEEEGADDTASAIPCEIPRF